MEWIAATNNAHKLAEMRRILERMGHTVLSQREAGLDLDPDETGATFAENAAIKAQCVCEAAGRPALADDSGLCVDALGGAPGVHSARWCGRHGDDAANNEKLLAELADVPASRRAAHFTSAICAWLPDGRHFTCEGQCPGRIAFSPAGENGFGYDEQRTYAQLRADEKDAISHRARALEAMEQQLPGLLADKTVAAFHTGPVTIELEEEHADE